ncbi:L-histidine N(alpha)-methyltransferase [Rhodomicrobium vannielii ATCC 17100]|uniref:L-histidine N(alpha)-methyltransferase n=1 Tax=Rhodomicrobium vannielii TaxID=1069 RepID=UPI00191827E8|nr:L-histidine N(alpha)-methyltransferase [Rhodomicrobium vannielii]MBJ7534386.1 L-histidine N(alpha)-methyltransferase [Rhodomicrobium vannielii ATCC 17100]
MMLEPFVTHEPHAKPDGDFLDAVLHGLSLPKKSLPSRFLYDAHGSNLFEHITELPEYYPTRTEIGLLKSQAREIGAALPSGAVVVEFGSGSSRKTELLLAALDRPAAYVPIDISAAALYPAARRIALSFPDVDVYPVLGGFHDLERMRLPLGDSRLVGFFPGSTIGNFSQRAAVEFLLSARRLLGPGAVFLLGVDLQKPLDILLPAYNDADGVTAAFNLNLLARINRDLEGTFDLDAFEHAAIYNERHQRIEMHLRSLAAQSASVAGRTFSFAAAETIHTENSHKYTPEGFERLARDGGWEVSQVFVDKNRFFSVQLLA